MVLFILLLLLLRCMRYSRHAVLALRFMVREGGGRLPAMLCHQTAAVAVHRGKDVF